VSSQNKKRCRQRYSSNRYGLPYWYRRRSYLLFFVCNGRSSGFQAHLN